MLSSRLGRKLGSRRRFPDLSKKASHIPGRRTLSEGRSDPGVQRRVGQALKNIGDHLRHPLVSLSRYPA
jgi:hypothetical protein